jgi:ribosomal protein S18 acetylase RimI-like enzyme
VDERADLRQRHDHRLLGELGLRPATPADAPAIAALHLAVWRDAYRTLAPPAVVERLDLAHRLARWAEYLADGAEARIVLVAVLAGRIVGFVYAGPPSHPSLGTRGEVKHLYVDRACARRGIGRALLTAAADALRQRGYAGVALGVVVGNDPAVAFYRALGGTCLGTYTDPGPAWRSENLIYAWDDAAALLARAG